MRKHLSSEQQNWLAVISGLVPQSRNAEGAEIKVRAFPGISVYLGSAPTTVFLLTHHYSLFSNHQHLSEVYIDCSGKLITRQNLD